MHGGQWNIWQAENEKLRTGNNKQSTSERKTLI
jgi:hypothetical protein